MQKNKKLILFKNFKFVDISYLQNLTGGDIAVMTEIINLFKLEVPRYLVDLKKSRELKNWDELAGVAHKAKSSFALMGIGEVVSELKNLELLAREKNESEQYDLLIKSVEDIYDKAIFELDQFLKNISIN